MRVRDRLREAGGRLREDVRKDVDVAKETVKRGEVLDREDARRAASRAKQIAGRLANEGSKVDVGSGDSDEVFRRAERASTMGAPVDATADPITAPEQTGAVATGGGEPRVDELAFGSGFQAEAPGGVDDFAMLGATSRDEGDSGDGSHRDPLAVDDPLGFGGE